MPQTCTICKHPQRLRIEQMMVARKSLREIVERYGTGKSILSRHRPHIAAAVARTSQAREMVRTGSLLESVRTGEQRAESLYEQAQEILAAALSNDDPRTALQAIRTASAVMSEARGYMELRGELTNELGRDRAQAPMSIQIICGSSGHAPRISFAQQDAIEIDADGDDGVAEIGLLQLA